MEYENQNENENKVGAGILTICIIHLIVNFFAIIGSVLAPALITPEVAAQYGISKESMTDAMIPTIIIAIVYMAACIMILVKQKIGVFVYYFVVLANIVITIALNGFSLITLLLSLVLPLLMGVFISKKKRTLWFRYKIK